MPGVDATIFRRAAVLQAATVGALFALLALLLEREFFREYGAVTGPLAWVACALLTGRLLGLAMPRVVLAAALAGALAAVVGVLVSHLAGLVVAIPAFGAVCAARSRRPVAR